MSKLPDNQIDSLCLSKYDMPVMYFNKNIFSSSQNILCQTLNFIIHFAISRDGSIRSNDLKLNYGVSKLARVTVCHNAKLHHSGSKLVLNMKVVDKPHLQVG